jgi:hypothetical protein
MRRADAYLRVLKAVVRSFDTYEEFHQTPTRFFFFFSKQDLLNLAILFEPLVFARS